MGTSQEELCARILANCVPEPNSGCLLWLGATTNGYGIVHVPGSGKKGRVVRCHRAIYESMFGLIPRGLDLMHRCDVRSCCNYDHLVPGTRQSNCDDMAMKWRDRRSKTGLPFGVWRHPNGVSYSASVRIDGVARYLGSYATVEEAHRVAVEAKQKWLETGDVPANLGRRSYGRVK